MKKYSCFILIFALLLLSLVSCSGYNKIMRDHLSNPENYQVYEAILTDIYYRDPVTKEDFDDLENSEITDYETVFIVTFETTEDVRAFLGGTPNPDIPLQEFDFALHVNSDNSKILHSNGFYDSVSLGDKITVTVSSWIYMNRDFFYIAQLECDGTEYLTFDEGLKNIVDMMNKIKSLF